MRAGEINPWLFQQSKAMPGMLNSDLRLGGSPEPFLSAIGQVCRRRNIRLIVAYVPFYGTINERYVSSLKACGMDEKTARELLSDTAYSRHSGELAEICKSLNIEFVDTAPALKKQEGAGTPQFWSFDSHPNPAGYETIAEAIFQAIGRK
jgi:lysophospholipase L1-like esterase